MMRLDNVTVIIPAARDGVAVALIGNRQPACACVC
jgi:hypothetical protein